MGNWHISIEGVGCHHNTALETDANKLAAKFVQELKIAGHTVNKSTFTYGGCDNLSITDCIR